MAEKESRLPIDEGAARHKRDSLCSRSKRLRCRAKHAPWILKRSTTSGYRAKRSWENPPWR